MFGESLELPLVERGLFHHGLQEPLGAGMLRLLKTSVNEAKLLTRSLLTLCEAAARLRGVSATEILALPTLWRARASVRTGRAHPTPPWVDLRGERGRWRLGSTLNPRVSQRSATRWPPSQILVLPVSSFLRAGKAPRHSSRLTACSLMLR